MKAYVDQDGCIACELCVEICPSVFRMTDDGDSAEAYVDEVAKEDVADAEDARDSCPVDVISLED